MPYGGNLEWCPFSEEGKRVFMEPDLPRPWADTVKPYATCWTVDGISLHPESRSERGGGRAISVDMDTDRHDRLSSLE